MFRPVKQNRVFEDIIEQIEGAIFNGRLPVGSRLPAERELQKMFETSRSTLREALRVLENSGLIEVRPGARGGVFVREASSRPVAEGLARLIQQRRISPDDLAGFRQVVESGLIRLVAERVTAEDLEELRALLDEMAPYGAMGPEGWDGLLNVEVLVRKKLVCISGSLMYKAVLFPIHENIFAYAKVLITGETARPEEAYRDWREIVEALAVGDTETAVAVTRAHIARYSRRMKAGLAAGQDRVPEIDLSPARFLV